MKGIVVLLCLTGCAVYCLPSGNKGLHEVGIKGGDKVTIDKVPYTVALSNQYGYIGTGVLINKQWVLTGGSVFGIKPNNLIVRMATENASAKGTTSSVNKIVIHPKYDLAWGYNIALVKLTKPVQLSAKVKTISLSNSLPKEGAQVTVSGYGNTVYELGTDGILREATVPYISYATCKNNYKAYKTFTKQNLCASKPGVGPCPGDWGDPLVYNKKLIGIFAGSEGDCGSKQYPGVYTDVTQFVNWVNSIIKS